jgi:hypothetical protein
MTGPSTGLCPTLRRRVNLLWCAGRRVGLTSPFGFRVLQWAVPDPPQASRVQLPYRDRRTARRFLGAAEALRRLGWEDIFRSQGNRFPFEGSVDAISRDTNVEDGSLPVSPRPPWRSRSASFFWWDTRSVKLSRLHAKGGRAARVASRDRAPAKLVRPECERRRVDAGLGESAWS